MGDYNASFLGAEQNKIEKLRKQSTPSALEPLSRDSLGHQHKAEKLSPNTALHLNCSVKVKHSNATG